jgi:DNA mismatch endonuclease (patch repair protein)
MSRIRGRGNRSTEAALAKLFRLHHINGWRRHQPIFGKPDFIFPTHRLALFVDGCFWHCCPSCYARPKSNPGFWAEKIARNRDRDRQVNRELRRCGWRVLRIWEHDLTSNRSVRCVARIQRALAAMAPIRSARSRSRHSPPAKR